MKKSFTSAALAFALLQTVWLDSLAKSVGLRTNALSVVKPSSYLIQTSDSATTARLPLIFEANAGQFDSDVAFLARGAGYDLRLKANEIEMTAHKPAKIERRRRLIESADASGVVGAERAAQTQIPDAVETTQTPLQIKLVGANRAAEIVGEDAAITKVNYFIGNDASKWRTDIPTYHKVRYRQVYPGVDMLFYENDGMPEYDFILSAGASPSSIKLQYAGADGLRIDEAGDLVIDAPQGEMRQRKPIVYQETESGERYIISGNYTLNGSTVGFRISDYDRNRSLVIDPVLIYSTLLGGGVLEQPFSIAVDAVGNAYVTGMTSANNFPTVNALQPARVGGTEAFISKLNRTGTALVYSTYIGGSGGEIGWSIAVDALGNVYVAGGTSSPNFPLKNPIRASLAGGSDAFILKLNSAGNALVYSTLWGGSGSESANGIAVDASGNAYVTGTTTSSDFPLVNALQTSYGGGMNDAFALKLNAAGNAVAYSTYLGGNATDQPLGIAIDSTGAAVIVGETGSSDFPVTPGALQTFLAGHGNAFTTKLSADGAQLVYSTYLGRSNADAAFAVALDAAGNAYITGGAGANFPVTNGAFQRTLLNPNGNAFVAKLNPTGSALIYATYVGGGGGGLEEGDGIAIDSSGNAYVIGSTPSQSFPLVNPFINKYGGDFSDAFVFKLNSTGSALIYSSYLGGSDYDIGAGGALDAYGNFYVTGETLSRDFPLVNPFQSQGGQIFITKIADSAAPQPNLIDDPQFFVKQHYIDFLSRLPDTGGLAFWTNQITSCGDDASCIDNKRQNVSAAYFLSREFQETGFFIIKLQRAAFGKLSNDATKRITFSQFTQDAQSVGNGFIDGQAGADQILDQNKTAYAQSVAGRASFISKYPTTLSAQAYVDALFSTAGVTPTATERQTAVNAFGSGDTAGRAAALRKVAETDSVKKAEFNAAFVLMQYFGYLRRNPTDAPDNNDLGYQFWLGKLNQFNGDYIQSQMVRSFIISPEYRQRFGAQ